MNAMIMNNATIYSDWFAANNSIDSKNNNVFLPIAQTDSKPAIDDVICQYMDGDMLKNALNFIEYVCASKMKIKWSAPNVWSVHFRRKHVLDILVRQDSWRVRLVFNHVTSGFGFSKREAERIMNLIGTLRNSIPENLEPIPAMS